MKKILALTLAMLLVLTMMTGCQSSPSADNTAKPSADPGSTATVAPKAEPYKIAVATIFEGETWEIQRKYYEEAVGPALNMEFMFSEKLSDANGLVDFMDKAYAAGCVGLINFVTSNDAVAQGARKANDFKMWFVTQNSALNQDVADIPYNLGHCGASAPGMRDAYGRAFEKLLSDGENHSLFIYSLAAVGGAIGQGAASHYYSTYGMLETMQNKYGLTYTRSIDEIVNTQEPGEVETGNPDISIYVCPGYDPSAAAVTAQAQFQNGKYDIFAAVGSYPVFTNVLGEIEANTGKNIMITGTANIEKQTATGFATMDATGNSVLSAAVINPLNVANGMCAVILYNALTGHADAMKDNGKTVLLGVEPWACTDAETYENIAKLDNSLETYVLGVEELKALCVENDPEVNFQTNIDTLSQLADVEAIIANKVVSQ